MACQLQGELADLGAGRPHDEDAFAVWPAKSFDEEVEGGIRLMHDEFPGQLLENFEDAVLFEVVGHSGYVVYLLDLVHLKL